MGKWRKVNCIWIDGPLTGGGGGEVGIPCFFSFGATAPPPPSGPWPPHSRGFLITHNDAPQSVGLLWTSDRLVAQTSTWQHTCPRWDSNPQSQQVSGHCGRRNPFVDREKIFDFIRLSTGRVGRSRHQAGSIHKKTSLCPTLCSTGLMRWRRCLWYANV